MDELLWIEKFGKSVRVTGLFSNDESCNKFLELNPGHSVIACIGDFVLTARNDDLGARILHE